MKFIARAKIIKPIFPQLTISKLLVVFFCEGIMFPNSQASAQVSVTDPKFTTDPQNIDAQWALPKAGFVSSWEKTTGTLSNVVAIIDTGIDATHEDLQNINFVPGFNFITNQNIVGRVNSDDNG